MNNGTANRINEDEKRGTGIDISESGFKGIVPQEESSGGILAQAGTSSEGKPDMGGPTGDPWGTRYWNGIFEKLEEKLPFTIVLLSLIGYVVISAFGQMNNLKKYGGYLLFLMLLFIFYKSQVKKNDRENKQNYRFNWFFIIGFIILFGILLLLIKLNWLLIIDHLAKTICGV
ncbi:MAG: hypothetical protein WC526_03580 [Patescibacteria group bacterium]